MCGYYSSKIKVSLDNDSYCFHSNISLVISFIFSLLRRVYLSFEKVDGNPSKNMSSTIILLFSYLIRDIPLFLYPESILSIFILKTKKIRIELIYQAVTSSLTAFFFGNLNILLIPIRTYYIPSLTDTVQ